MRLLLGCGGGSAGSDEDPAFARFELRIVPEPGTLALVALGRGALARRRS